MCDHGLQCRVSTCPRIHGTFCAKQAKVWEATGHFGGQCCAYDILKSCEHKHKCHYRHFEVGTLRAVCICLLSSSPPPPLSSLFVLPSVLDRFGFFCCLCSLRFRSSPPLRMLRVKRSRNRRLLTKATICIAFPCSSRALRLIYRYSPAILRITNSYM